ncbi:MAG TPA: hypothetical protein VHN98_06175 [Acidimicrobiales bacterium]|nr:hypothetical protein [Acidimicrobiales bacterium]
MLRSATDTVGSAATVSVGEVIDLEETLRHQLRGLDPSRLTPATAARLQDRYLALGRLAAAAVTVLAARAADAGEWKQRGSHSPAHDLSRRAGTTVGAARDLLDTSSRLADLEATNDALRAGRLSVEQAGAVAAAAAADRRCEADMLARAEAASLVSLREHRDRIVAAAESPEDAEARQRRIHETRSLRFGTAPDGAGTGSWRVAPDVQAVLRACLAPFIERRFDAARRDGRREGAGAYAADALVDMARAAYGADVATSTRAAGAEQAAAARAAKTAAANPPSPPSPAGAPKVPAKIIVRIDHTALLRGHTTAGETCEIAGVGPVPVDTITRLLATGDVFWAAVITRGTDVASVVHLGRRPNALQLTALHWRDPTCREEACSRPVREWDHHLDWARTHHTILEELGGFCDHHHDLKTYNRYRLAPSRLPGKVRLLPPDDPDPPLH